jgi:hypothetical protein
VASVDAGEEAPWIVPGRNESVAPILIEGPLILSERGRGQKWSVAER